MKPQCETTADCLEQLARVMRQFGFTNTVKAVKSKYVRQMGFKVMYSADELPKFTRPEEWSFAIAEVEGKAVFIGDELYSPEGKKFLATEIETMFHCASWNPPKPKDVTLKIPVNVADSIIRFAANREMIFYGTSIQELADACEKALGELK